MPNLFNVNSFEDRKTKPYGGKCPCCCSLNTRTFCEDKKGKHICLDCNYIWID